MCPLFTSVAATWSGLQDEMVILSNLNTLTQTIHSHTKCLHKLPLSRLLPLVEPLAVLTDEQRGELYSKEEIDSNKLQCDLIYPGRKNMNIIIIALFPIHLKYGTARRE